MNNSNLDTVFTGGFIYTGDEPCARRGSVVVRDETIISLHDDDATEALRRGAKRVDLDGRLLIPGFQDAHVHPVVAGIELLSCDLSLSATADEALALIADYARQHPDLAWITGAGWSMGAFPGGTPTRHMLDAVVPDRPVLLENRDHHSAWVNTAALRAAGFTEATPDPTDGRFERESDGYPAGTVHDGAIFLFDQVRPGATEDGAYAGLIAAQHHLLSLGITAWQDAAIGALMGQPDTLPVYERALAEGTLIARVRGAEWWDRTAGLEQLPHILQRHRRIASSISSDRFALGTVKIMVDGVAESRTAAMHGCYRDHNGNPTDDSGMTFFSRKDLTAFVTAIDAAGLQMHFHALGDRAVTDTLDALDAARLSVEQRGSKRENLRHHLAHLEVVRPEDIARFAKLDASANIQPYWAAHDEQLDQLVLPHLPGGAQAHLYPFASLAAAGTHLAIGSDWPVSSPDPLQAISVGVNRRHALSSAPSPRLSPSESLTLKQLLDAATSGSAFVNHLDERTGRLKPGMLADFAIVNHNLFDLPNDELHTASIDATYIDGVEVWARPGA